MNVKQLRAAFADDAWPQFLAMQYDRLECVVDLHVAATIRWFAGHFPGEPVLAGVVQTHWAAELGKFIFAPPSEFSRLDNLKFHSVIMPEQTLKLTLEYDPHTPLLRFRYHQGESVFSEGKFVF